jgi:hypothetical protein
LQLRAQPLEAAPRDELAWQGEPALLAELAALGAQPQQAWAAQ